MGLDSVESKKLSNLIHETAENLWDFTHQSGAQNNLNADTIFCQTARTLLTASQMHPEFSADILIAGIDDEIDKSFDAHRALTSVAQSSSNLKLDKNNLKEVTSQSALHQAISELVSGDLNLELYMQNHI